MGNELEEPLLDVVLSPGNVLYIPAGYPHTTDTTSGISDHGEPSVHLTVGIDTHIWGLNYASLRESILKKAAIKDKILLSKIEPRLYWDIQSSLPLGFLRVVDDDDDDDHDNDDFTKLVLDKMNAVDNQQTLQVEDTMVKECVEKVKWHCR